MVMDWWQKIVRRLLFLSVKTRDNGAGLLKLHNDIQTCGYEDVQVMWEMLSRSESELTSRQPKRKQRSILRVFENQNSSSP